MKFSDTDLLKKIAAGEIVITPPIPPDHIGSFSIDLRLGSLFRVFKHTQCPFIDLSAADSQFSMSDKLMDNIQIEQDGAFYLPPGELALGITVEHISLPPDIVGWLDGRSSLARLGLMVHVTAHTIDPGWSGKITLEFANINRIPLALRPGMRICAISFEPLSSPTSRPYRQKKGAKYIEQNQPLASKIYRDR